MIKALTFDLWNTLISDKNYIDQRIKCLANTLLQLNILRSREEIRESYLASHEFAHKILREENYRYVSAYERLNHVLEVLSAKLSEDFIKKVLNKFEEYVIVDPPPLIEGVKETLEFLSSNYRMAIICDTGLTPGKVLRRVLMKYEILWFFEATVFSDEIGYNKPNKKMFETALASLEAKPSEAIHVGDLLQTDIVGANAIGMKTVWFNSKGTPSRGYKPDYQISKFRELISILNGLNF